MRIRTPPCLRDAPPPPRPLVATGARLLALQYLCRPHVHDPALVLLRSSESALRSCWLAANAHNTPERSRLIMQHARTAGMRTLIMAFAFLLLPVAASSWWRKWFGAPAPVLRLQPSLRSHTTTRLTPSAVRESSRHRKLNYLHQCYTNALQVLRMQRRPSFGPPNHPRSSARGHR